MSYHYYWATGGHSAQPLYEQFQHNGFWVGCGPVAWTMLFCWADRQAATGNSYWADRWGLYRENGGYGANAVAPLSMDNGVRNVIKEIHGYVGTFNLAGNGATFPWDMVKAAYYFSGRTGTDMETHHNTLGIHTWDLFLEARGSIVYRHTPVVIGVGWLNHYPMAYGYKWRKRIVKHSFLFWEWTETVYDRYFYVNQGWQGSGNGWIPASTFFAGEIMP